MRKKKLDGRFQIMMAISALLTGCITQPPVRNTTRPVFNTAKEARPAVRNVERTLIVDGQTSIPSATEGVSNLSTPIPKIKLISTSNDAERPARVNDAPPEGFNETSAIEPVTHDPYAQEIIPSVSSYFRGTYPIDLPTALRLGNADNLQVALAREQIRQAYAEYAQSDVMWLPSIRSGIHYNKHEGPLLSSSGDIRNTSRGSIYAGAGASAVGGGSPAIPGILVNFHFADAIFQPLALQQRSGARESAAAATRNDTLFNIAIGYIELLRSEEDLAIAKDVRDKMQEVSRMTDAFAQAGQGLVADADRMRVELGLRGIDVRRCEEASVLASTRLAQLLRLQACCRLEPIEPGVVEITMTKVDAPCCQLVSQALQNRPELRQSKFLVGETVERLRREKYAPLVPSLLLGASYGGFGGGHGSQIDDFNDRLDFDATAFWEVRNLGLGEQAAQRTSRSRLRQAQLQELTTMDQVAREVIESHAQVVLRKTQVDESKQLVEYAIDSYNQNVIRIRNGQGLPIETLQSVQALLQSRREFLRSVSDYNSAQFALRRALGWPVDASSEFTSGSEHTVE